MYNNELNTIFSEATRVYSSGATVENRRNIPTQTTVIPKDGNHWLRIDDVLCIYIDMKNSTNLSASHKERETANIYEYFTDTAVRILDHFGAAYIDVRGDGAFGLFNKSQFYHGMTAAITFIDFANTELKNNAVYENHPITCHIGADMKTVLVKRIGIRSIGDQTDRQNEVWAGKPVNMASKLASRGGDNHFLISDRVYNRIKSDNCESLLLSCGCSGQEQGDRTDAWEKQEISEQEVFDFSVCYKLKPKIWCREGGHGNPTMNKILSYDNETL